MKVLLKKDFKTLGKKGDIKDVSDGYACNYLIPNGICVVFNEQTKLEYQKELERERKAELEGQKNAQKEAKKAENKSKNQKQIDKLNKENEELEKIEQELYEREKKILEQNAILLTGLSNETTEMSNAQISAPGGGLADYDVDENGKLIFPKDSNLSPEEKAELQKEYDEIIEISKQNEKEIGLTREEREQNHFNDYVKTVNELNEINAKLDEINKSGNENNNFTNEDRISDEHAMEVIKRGEDIESLKKQKEELENRLAYKRDIVQNDIFAKMQRTQAGLTKEEAEKSITSDQRMAIYNQNMQIIEAIRGEKRQIKKLRETNKKQIENVGKRDEIDHHKRLEAAVIVSSEYNKVLEDSLPNLKEKQKVTEAYAKNVSDERERYRILADSIMEKMKEIEKLPKEQRDEEYAKMNQIISSLKRSAYKENEKACEQLLGMLKNSSAEKGEKSSNSPSSNKGKEEVESSSPPPTSKEEENEMGNSK